MTSRHSPRGRRGDAAGPLTTADLVVLSLLLERPMHGYDLLAEYERQEVADWASISKAQVYYALKKLERMSLLVGATVPDDARERTVYRPTEAGEAALAEALANPAWAAGRVAQPFTTWFGLSMHADEAAQEAVLRARLAWIDDEIAKECDSLAFIATLAGPRARKGEAIVRLVLAQLETERVWVRERLGDG
jgi:DNA-binding PadR family transcriptional regulator